MSNVKLTEEQIWKCNQTINYEKGEVVDAVHICLDHQNVVDFARAIEREIGFAKAELWIKRINDSVEAEREACAELVWPKFKVWSEKEQLAMNLAFVKAQEKHGRSETLMSVGAAVLKMKAEAIRARGTSMIDLQQTAPEQQAELLCPSCKAAVLYECVACSSNNYPPQQDGNNG